MNKQITNLDNNIEFFYKRNENTPRVALCMNFSINNPEKSAGIYVLMTRLFLQGTKNRTAEQLAEELDSYAIEFSNELKQDYLRFRFVCLNEDFSKALEIMSDIIKNSTFEEFDKEIAKMEGEITAELDSPRAKVSDGYYKTMFENHPYGNTSTKILENIKNITKQDIIEAYNSILQNSKKVITFVGDLDFDSVLPELNKNFAELPNDKDEKNHIPVETLTSHRDTEIIKPDANQAHLLKGWQVPSYLDKDYPALVLLNIILGASGLSSRLFLELRDKKGLAYVVRSSYEPLGLCGNFSIYIATEPKNIEVSLAGFKEEIEKIKSIPVGEEELENAKNNIIGKWAFTTETNNQQACILAHHGIMGLGFDFLEKTKQAVKAVTSEQLQQCANRYFNDNYVYAVLKP